MISSIITGDKKDNIEVTTDNRLKKDNYFCEIHIPMKYSRLKFYIHSYDSLFVENN